MHAHPWAIRGLCHGAPGQRGGSEQQWEGGRNRKATMAWVVWGGQYHLGPTSLLSEYSLLLPKLGPWAKQEETLVKEKQFEGSPGRSLVSCRMVGWACP